MERKTVNMSKKDLKQYEHSSCRLDQKAMDQLEEMCDDIGITKTKAIEKAIGKVYEDYKKTGKI